MKIAVLGDGRVGIVREDRVYDVGGVVGWNAEDPQASLVRLMSGFDQLKTVIEDRLPACPSLPLSAVQLGPPVPSPSKIVAAPVNYKLHQDEMNQQFQNAAYTVENLGFFLKSPSSIVGPSSTVLLPFRDRRTDHEAELAFVVGRRAKDVPAERAAEYIFGYFALMDITVRGHEDRPWRKSFDTFTPIGPWIVTADEMGDPHDADIRLWVNGDLRQSSNTRWMIFNCFKFFEAVSRVMTLLPGDVVTTGTPEGVGSIQAGDTVRIHIDRIGSFEVNVDYKPGV
ncbi:MAG: fumarylacetoacetate hydrolase family protein [Alicyclobacillaceae bacterium]|nr:fumarylacetoacetate hydrolase family protein [Alicyclobacillaceae bacterium]